jgi:hypothetical protein
LRYASRHRAGTVYIAVLGVAIIVGVIGICSLHVARLEVREVTALADMANARLAARSGVECAIAKMRANSGWRSSFASGVANLVSNLTGILTGDDSFEFTYIDSDGNLDDDDNDAVTVRSIGTSGGARHVIEVLLMPSGQGVSSLSVSLHTDGKLELTAALTTNQTASASDEIKITSPGIITGNARSTSTISGTVTGTKWTNMAEELELPDPEDVFEYYLSKGTPITYGQLPSGTIENVLFSAGVNPYGSQVTDPQGIYVIDCQGGNLIIRNCRIRATLVLINANTVTLDGSILWEPHVASLPAMMVQGRLKFNCDSQLLLSETSANMNFNPPHTPYTTGSDTDKADSYLGSIAGLVYSTSDLEINNRSIFKGVIVTGGSGKSTGSVNLTYDSSYYNNAPPGFTSGTDMQIVPGTWKQVSY